MNFYILLLHITIVGALTLFFLRLGKEAICAFVALLALLANFFTLKQITLFGLSVTCSDALAVGYLLASNLIQEFFGFETAKKAIWISFCLSLAFLLLSTLHLFYMPNQNDVAHPHYAKLLSSLPRVTFASFFAFLVTQFLDLFLFRSLKVKMSNNHLTLRVISCTMIAHLIDTVLFTYAGLYGVVASVGSVICFSFFVKCIVIFLTLPFIVISKRVVSA